jgi:hypothetical protein
MYLSTKGNTIPHKNPKWQISKDNICGVVIPLNEK